MEDGRILDRQLTSSSDLDGATLNHGVLNARLHHTAGNWRTGAWTAFYQDPNQWIQVEFDAAKFVSGIVLQGREEYDQWVTAYKVQYSNDNATSWRYVEPKDPHHYNDSMIDDNMVRIFLFHLPQNIGPYHSVD